MAKVGTDIKITSNVSRGAQETKSNDKETKGFLVRVSEQNGGWASKANYLQIWDLGWL